MIRFVSFAVLILLVFENAPRRQDHTLRQRSFGEPWKRGLAPHAINRSIDRPKRYSPCHPIDRINRSTHTPSDHSKPHHTEPVASLRRDRLRPPPQPTTTERYITDDHRLRTMSKRAAHAQQLPPPPQHAAIPSLETSQALEAAQRELRRVQTVRPWLLMMRAPKSKLRPSHQHHTTTHTRSCKPRRSRGSAPRTPRCRPGR